MPWISRRPTTCTPRSPRWRRGRRGRSGGRGRRPGRRRLGGRRLGRAPSRVGGVGRPGEGEVQDGHLFVRVTLNGHVIVDGDILEKSRNGTMDHQRHPGLQREQGHIGWLSHDSVVKFRNVRIKDLSGKKTD